VLQDAVRSICAQAGWREPAEDEAGAYSFVLEGDLAFSLSSPDAERLLARAPLIVPAPGEGIADEILEAVVRVTAARFSRLRAVPSLDPATGRLELHVFARLRELNDKEKKDFVEAFCNELAFWKAQPALAGAPL
jgi:hypothetical protein